MSQPKESADLLGLDETASGTVYVLTSKYHGSNTQLLALAREIAGGRGVQEVRCDLRSRSSALRPIFFGALALRRALPASFRISKLLQKLVLQGADIQVRNEDVIVAKTPPFELPLQILAAGTQASKVFVGQPKRFSRTQFDHIISTPSTPSKEADIELEVVPTSFKYSDIPSDDRGGKIEIIGLLLGGDASGYQYSPEFWRKLISFMEMIH